MKISEKITDGYKELTVENSAGLTLRLTALGAAIREIKVPDKFGEIKTVTLCPTSDAIYRKEYYGKSIGRTAGRIQDATFTIDGKTANLQKNNKGADNLHGGVTGFHSVVFDCETVETPDYTDVVFSYASPDGEGGYFGNVKFTATYRVRENENSFRIIYDGESDTRTLLNVTNHVYLNLSGNLEESAKEHRLYINASRFGKLSERLIIEDILPVTKEMNFRKPHKIGDYVYEESVQKYTCGYDHQYFLDTESVDELACALECEKSGVKLEVRTSYPCVVLYTNSCPHPEYEVYPGKHDEQYMAACLECQYHPDGIHACPDNCGILSPEKPYHEEIDYRFGIVK